MKSAALIALAAVTLLGGCVKNHPCRPGTIFVTVTLEGAAVDADSFDVTATLDGSSLHATVARVGTSATGTLALEFASGMSYPAGKSLTLSITATQSGQPVGTGVDGPVTLPSGCANLQVTVTGGSGSDGGGADSIDPCHDGVKDGTESDIDCGGSCTPCVDGQVCASGADCTSTICNLTTALCVATRCLDGVKDDAESDIDCGGGTCPACGDQMGCGANSDCTSSFCDQTSSTCVAGHCLDQVTDSTESDKDCGGADCPGCAIGKTCGGNSDCASAYCSGTSCASCSPQLVAMEPQVANVGAMLTLEGAFCGNVVVTFPGGIKANATLLGTNRATVVVPAGATTGNLTVSVGPNATAPLPFRTASFALGLDQFGPHYDQASGGRLMPSLTTPRYAHSTVVVGGYVYMIGGYSNSGPLQTVERATINADGTLGAFSTLVGVTLVTPRYYHSSVVIGSSYIYVIGGVNATTVERATINADGSISTFATVSGVTQVDGRYSSGVVVLGNSLYVVGGQSNTNGTVGTVERASILSDGSISTFATVAGVTQQTARIGHTLTVVGNRLYAIGDGTTVEQATIGGDGSISTFATVAGVTLQSAIQYHVTAVLGNAVYVLGGYDDTYEPTVEKATINGDGTLSTFATISTSNFTTGRYNHSLALVGSYLYVLGGYGGAGPLASVERASINADSALSTFGALSGAGLATARSGHASVVLGNYLYVIGGFAGSALTSIERATVNPDGTLSTFADAGVALSTARAYHCAAAVGNYLYVVGGNNGSDLATVERATINADGTLTTFADAGVPLANPRSHHTCVALGSLFYVFDGSTAGSSVSEVDQAPIESDGTLDSFTYEYNSTTARSGQSNVVIGPYLYLIGGLSTTPLSTGPLDTIEQIQFAVTGGLNSFLGVIASQLVTGRSAHSNVVVGNSLYVMGGLATNPLASVESATIGSDGSITTFGGVTGVALAIARQDFGSALVGNTLYVIGGLGAGALATVERAGLP